MNALIPSSMLRFTKMLRRDSELNFSFKKHLIFLMSVVFQIICVGVSFTSLPLLMTILVFPSLFIIPGVLFSLVVSEERNLVKLVVEGFFVSTLLLVLLTLLFQLLGFALIPLTYFTAVLIITSFLSAIGLVRHVEFKPSRSELFVVILAFSLYTVFTLYFSSFPRLFTPDETSYIFSSRIGVSSGMPPPMGVRPDKSTFAALFSGRNLWISLLTAFSNSTGLPAYEVGLIGIGFLIMTALTSSLLISNDRKLLSTLVFVLVALNPLLLSFSNLALNDLAIAFYGAFSVLFFVNGFTKSEKIVKIDFKSMFYSLVATIFLILIKPNLIVLAAMWIVLIFVMVRYKLYKTLKQKLLFLSILLPVVIYESIDAIYVVYAWFLNINLNFLASVLVVSPLETLIGVFKAPYWAPNTQTIFSWTSVQMLDYFYRFITPESSGLLISALILLLPIFLFQKRMRKDFNLCLLSVVVIVSFYAFYFQSLSFSQNFTDVSRFSLWMIPLWIPLAVTIVYQLAKEKSANSFLLIVATMILIQWINLYVSQTNGGVYVGYIPLGRTWTFSSLFVEIICLTILLGLVTIKSDFVTLSVKLSNRFVKKVNVNKIMFFFLASVIILSSIYYDFYFTQNNYLYRDHGLIETSDELAKFASNSSIVFANNYIYMRPFVEDKLLNSGLILPPPSTKDEFIDLLKLAPAGTLFLISNDPDTTWYEYANEYIKNYTSSDIIAPYQQTTKIPILNLTGVVLDTPFDDTNSSIVPDHSFLGNNGVNNGAEIVTGVNGKSLLFNGDAFVTIPANDNYNFNTSLTINFLANIQKASPSQGYMILSKGYAPQNGSFDVFIWDTRIYFEIGGVGSVSFPAEQYLGSWHSFIFTYDGEEINALVDGNIVASDTAEGLIHASSFNIVVGRDGLRNSYDFVGSLEALQISSSPLNITKFLESYVDCYLLRIDSMSLPTGESALFKLIKSDTNTSGNGTSVQDVSMSTDNSFSPPTIDLSVRIDSLTAKNVTVLVATDRFTQPNTILVKQGINDVKLEFPYVIDPSWYESGGRYWLHLTQTRVIVIDGNDVVYDGFVSPFNIKLIITLLMAIIGVVLFLILAFSFKRKRSK